MRAKFIYETFTEDTDPITDMGIGHDILQPQTEWNEMVKPYLEKWEQKMQQKLLGKVVKGKFLRGDYDNWSFIYKTPSNFPILVKKVICLHENNNFNLRIQGTSGTQFEFIPKLKYKIELYKNKEV